MITFGPVQSWRLKPQPGFQCLSHIDGQWQDMLAALAGDPHMSAAPVDVVERQAGGFTSS